MLSGSATGHTPYELLLGNAPISSLRASLESTPGDLPQTVTDSISSSHHIMVASKQVAKQVEAKTKQDSKAHHNRKKKEKESILKPGTRVMCFEPRKQKGLTETWLGPYTALNKLR